jgi:hypothetical protein
METESLETIHLSLDDFEGDSNEPYLVTVGVTSEQESAMEAFFQINSWQLIKGKFKVINIKFREHCYSMKTISCIISQLPFSVCLENGIFCIRGIILTVLYP